MEAVQKISLGIIPVGVDDSLNGFHGFSASLVLYKWTLWKRQLAYYAPLWTVEGNWSTLWKPNRHGTNRQISCTPRWDSKP